MHFCFQQIMRYFLENYAPKIMCESFNAFQQKFLIFQFIKLPSSFNNFHTKLSKAKKKGKEGVLLQNKPKQFFSFPSCDWLYFFQSWHILNGKTRAQVPTSSSIECLECLVDLLHLWMLFATKQWLFAEKMYFYLREKNWCISQGMKKT